MSEATAQSVADKAVADLVAGRFQDVEAAVKPDGRSTLSAANIGEVWSRATRASGEFEAVGEPLVSNVGGGELFDYPLTFSRGAAHLQVVVTAGEVAGLLLRPGGPTGQWNK